jgi:hypothetical protein
MNEVRKPPFARRIVCFGISFAVAVAAIAAVMTWFAACSEDAGGSGRGGGVDAAAAITSLELEQVFAETAIRAKWTAAKYPEGQSYEISWQEGNEATADLDAASGGTPVSGATETTISANLDGGKTYAVWVRAVSASGSKGAWSGKRVIPLKRSETGITFSVVSGGLTYLGTLKDDYIIEVVLPKNAPSMVFTPTISWSDSATLDEATPVRATDFSKGLVPYIIRAEDGRTRTYHVQMSKDEETVALAVLASPEALNTRPPVTLSRKADAKYDFLMKDKYKVSEWCVDGIPDNTGGTSFRIIATNYAIGPHKLSVTAFATVGETKVYWSGAISFTITE